MIGETVWCKKCVWLFECSNVYILVCSFLQYALYKKMTLAAILIQSKFRSYYEQKKFQQSRRAAMLIQQYYRSYKELGRPTSHSHAAAAAALVQHKLRYGRHKRKALLRSGVDSKSGFIVGGTFTLSAVLHSGANQSQTPVRLCIEKGVANPNSTSNLTN